MERETLYTLTIALGFAAIHLWGDSLQPPKGKSRGRWLSFGGGIAAAYIFLHLLHDLGNHEEKMIRSMGWDLPEGLQGRLVYVAALAGLVLFYWLESKVRKQGGQDGESTSIFYIHVGVFAVYNLVAGCLLVQRLDPDPVQLIFQGLGMGFHFYVNDQALRRHHGGDYHRRGRWILAASPPAGWALSTFWGVPPVWLALSFAVLAGAIVLNVLKEEIPEEQEASFPAFAAGSGLFLVLLLTLS